MQKQFFLNQFNTEMSETVMVDNSLNVSPLNSENTDGKYLFVRKLKDFVQKNLYVILTFFISFSIMIIVFGIMNVSPFGNADSQILVSDLFYQYFPFLSDFQSKLKSGESLFWTWSIGGGTNYLALISYYLASPFNFLTVFIPSNWLREFLMLSVSIKIALGGMFTAIFLRSVYKKNDISIMLFGCCFSFCAFFMGYYWNTIWLDTVCITPLVALGTIKLLVENKFKLYTISLALSILANYYIGLFTCIFILLIFIAYNIVYWKNFKTFIINIVKMFLFSVLGIGIAAFIVLPAFFSLNNTSATSSTFPTTFAINIGDSNDLIGIFKALKSIFANFMNFTCPSTGSESSLPNISCGTTCIFFFFLFLTTKKIRRKEKIVFSLFLLFMILSCILKPLEYIWHGFHFPNMIPYRFSYLISFALITMAFKAFITIDSSSVFSIIIALLGSIAVFSFSINDDNIVKQFACYDTWLTPTLISSAIFILVLFVSSLLYLKHMISKTIFYIVISFIVITQCLITALFGVKVNTVTSAANYPEGEEDTEQIIQYMNLLEENTAELWRAEMIDYQTLNDSALNHYNGLSFFSSTINRNVTNFFSDFGMVGDEYNNRYTYIESSPISNMFMNLKYLISRDGVYKNTYDLIEVYSISREKLLLNTHYIPVGFMTNCELLQWSKYANLDQLDSFDRQNEFFRLATGIDKDVYTKLEFDVDGPYKWNYNIPEDGIYFQVLSKAYGMDKSCITCIGFLNKDTKISTFTQPESEQSETVRVSIALFNQDIFEEGYRMLSRNVMTTTKCNSNSMKGFIDVKQSGLFYTSIPYEEGWTAFVDNQQVDITPIDGALIAFPLSEGTHNISLIYYPKGFWTGLIISSVCMLTFLFICFYVSLKHKSK